MNDSTRPLNIYFAGSIRGGCTLEQRMDYDTICLNIGLKGHKLTAEHQAADANSQMHKLNEREIYQRDTKAIRESDLLIAEISTPSHGVGYEIAYAMHYARIAVVCLYKTGSNPSAMLTGNDWVTCFEYSNALRLSYVLHDLFNILPTEVPAGKTRATFSVLLSLAKYKLPRTAGLIDAT